MPNRILRESICTSETIKLLSPEEEVFFYRLLVVCDDFGRMDARPAILRAKCYPLIIDKITENDISKWLNSLVNAELIYLYVVDGKTYLQVTTWDKYQQKRAKNSKYPSPDDGMIAYDIICNQTQSDDSICPRETRNEKREYENTRSELSSPTANDDPPSKSKPNKNKYAEFVSMTEDEYQKLVTAYGEVKTRRMIEILDNYKGANGKKYKSDYRAILNWVVDRLSEEDKKRGVVQADIYSPYNTEFTEVAP
jgi:hypothetical protein